MLDSSRPAEIAELQEKLEARVIGQPEPIAKIIEAYARWRAGLAGLDKPVAAFLMVGPTGIGKTLTVEALAEVLHGDRHHLVKVHCAEHRHSHEMSRLLGSPAGYIGHGQTEPAFSRRRINEARSEKCPLALILLDEIEKAHPDFWDLFLGVLDKGELNLGTGDRVDLREAMIFMTSNVGSQGSAHSIGFQAHHSSLPTRHCSEARRLFTPEFRNRLTGILVYRALSGAELRRVAEIELRRLVIRLAVRMIVLTFTPAAAELIVDQAAAEDPGFGGRPIRRVIDRLVELPVAHLIVSGQIAKGDEVGVTALKGELKFVKHGR